MRRAVHGPHNAYESSNNKLHAPPRPLRQALPAMPPASLATCARRRRPPAFRTRPGEPVPTPVSSRALTDRVQSSQEFTAAVTRALPPRAMPGAPHPCPALAVSATFACLRCSLQCSFTAVPLFCFSQTQIVRFERFDHGHAFCLSCPQNRSFSSAGAGTRLESGCPLSSASSST